MSDFVERALSQREIIRASGAVSLSIEKIQQHFEAGEDPRDDDFFRIRMGQRPKAEELFEAMMLKSKNQYEEQKVHLYSNLYANSCFDESISPDMVSWFMQVIDRLTYGHLSTLNAFVKLSTSSKWLWGDLNILSEKSPILAAQLEELKGIRLLSLDHWGDTPIAATDIAQKFINIIEFTDELKTNEAIIISLNGAKNI